MNFFETNIEFLKGVGPSRATLLKKELNIFTYGDLIQHYPFRYEDRTKYYKISEVLPDMSAVQIRGRLKSIKLVGAGRKQRLSATLIDETGQVELVWFKGVSYMHKYLKAEAVYVIYAKPNVFKNQISFAHPEIEVYTGAHDKGGRLQPVYNTTELLKKKFLDSKAISKLQQALFQQCLEHIHETLPSSITQQLHLIDKRTALLHIHFPTDQKSLMKAQARLKFEELFFIQLKLFRQKHQRRSDFQGQIFGEIPTVTEFYTQHLPFELTEAQKRVIKEIRKDLNSGKQMNRLLQGDVGSGKTVVGFILMLMAIDNGAQSCIMAPTEILAEQHYRGLKEWADILNIPIAILTGSTKKSDRNIIHRELLAGELKLIVGTHALLEDTVQFRNLGLCIIDEQHRFGVAQRAKLWNKNKTIRPHILVMTATPIPRTLAMTLYGDLDVSVIDELPAGRKPIETIHMYDSSRLRAFGFIREQIQKGRQVYIVYPLIEESETLDLKNLTDGYESISRAFPEFHLSLVHGRMKPAAKEFEMQRFVKGETQIMVATTVIEVGVNVPNATVMVIENAERFGLSQLHQLRGRVGRGADQSYCLLMSSFKLSKESKIRLDTMVRTNNGFEIADVDLKLRGPGDLSGTQQSGVLDLLISDLAKDSKILTEARLAAEALLGNDPHLESPENAPIKTHIASLRKTAVNWSRIS